MDIEGWISCCEMVSPCFLLPSPPADRSVGRLEGGHSSFKTPRPQAHLLPSRLFISPLTQSLGRAAQGVYKYAEAAYTFKFRQLTDRQGRLGEFIQVVHVAQW